MLSPLEMFYVAVGLASIAVIFAVNAPLFRRAPAAISAMEMACYATALAALLIGWYFNFQYFRQYADQVGWWHWTQLLFVNPASASGGQDLIIANLILFPLWTVVDGRRSGMKAPWLYFLSSLLTSYAFAFALFLAIRDRQLRSTGAPA